MFRKHSANGLDDLRLIKDESLTGATQASVLGGFGFALVER